MSAEPCGCGKPLYDPDEDLLPSGCCPHWAVEEVPTNRLREGDVFAIRGDLPLEVSWHVVVGHVEPTTGGHHHRSVHGGAIVGPSMPFEPTQLTKVLRFGMVGAQTLDA